MLIRLEPCANGFVLGAHWKSFHSTVQIQWARSVSQVHSGWTGCFSSLLRRWRALTARQRHWVWNGSSRSSSPPHMQCVLSSPYLISSAAAERRACMCLYVCASVVAFLSEGATKCILFLPHLILRLAGNWQSCPRHSNYFIEQRCFLWHDASQKIPQITLVMQLEAVFPECVASLNGLYVCWAGRMPHLRWSHSTTSVVGGGGESRPPKESIQIWYPSIHPVNPALQLSNCLPL